MNQVHFGKGYYKIKNSGDSQIEERGSDSRQTELWMAPFEDLIYQLGLAQTTLGIQWNYKHTLLAAVAQLF